MHKQIKQPPKQIICSRLDSNLSLVGSPLMVPKLKVGNVSGSIRAKKFEDIVDNESGFESSNESKDDTSSLSSNTLTNSFSEKNDKVANLTISGK